MTKAEREILEKLNGLIEQVKLLSSLILEDYAEIEDDDIGEVAGHA